jgi:hypothetical protein
MVGMPRSAALPAPPRIRSSLTSFELGFVVPPGGRLADQICFGVLTRVLCHGEDVDDAVAAAGQQAKRCDGKLPPLVMMVYFAMAMAMAMALFAVEDYEEIAARLAESLRA